MEEENSPDCYDDQVEPSSTCFDDDDVCTVVEAGTSTGTPNSNPESQVNPNIVCRKCYKKGHVAIQCTEKKNNDGMKQYLREEGLGLAHHLTQQERRWRNICEKRGWNTEQMRGCKGFEWSRNCGKRNN